MGAINLHLKPFDNGIITRQLVMMFAMLFVDVKRSASRTANKGDF